MRVIEMDDVIVALSEEDIAEAEGFDTNPYISYSDYLDGWEGEECGA